MIARGLHGFAILLYISMFALILLPCIGSIFSDAIANRVHLVEAVLISGFGGCGTLATVVKGIEQWGLNKTGQRDV